MKNKIAFMTSPLSERPDYGKSDSSVPRGEDHVSFIEYDFKKGEYCVYSPNNPDWVGGCYDTKEEASERLKQIEFFKIRNKKKKKKKKSK